MTQPIMARGKLGSYIHKDKSVSAMLRKCRSLIEGTMGLESKWLTPARRVRKRPENRIYIYSTLPVVGSAVQKCPPSVTRTSRIECDKNTLSRGAVPNGGVHPCSRLKFDNCGLLGAFRRSALLILRSYPQSTLIKYSSPRGRIRRTYGGAREQRLCSGAPKYKAPR